MTKMPSNWALIEEFEGSFVFENTDGSFTVFIDFDPALKIPYHIGYEQMEGDFELIEIEEGNFTARSQTLEDAYEKAVLLMQFIDSQINPAE